MGIKSIIGASILMLVSVQVNAALIEYDISATMRSSEPGGYFDWDVTGKMFFDEPEVLLFPIGDHIATFITNIPSFSLTIGDYQYDGDGVIYSQVWKCLLSCSEYQVIPWDSLSLRSSDGLFRFNDIATSPVYYYSDGTPYERYGPLADFLASDYLNLPYRIEENFTSGTGSGIQFSGHTGALIDLVIQQTPVPIPSAVWLFGSGLIGLVGIARSKNV